MKFISSNHYYTGPDLIKMVINHSVIFKFQIKGLYRTGLFVDNPRNPEGT